MRDQYTWFSFANELRGSSKSALSGGGASSHVWASSLRMKGMTMAKTLSQEPAGKTEPALQEPHKAPKNGTLTPQQTAVLAECPSAYKPTLKRAYLGNSKAAAIKAMCLACTGWLRLEVRNCSARGCPVWSHRPYQTSDTEQDD